MSEVPFRFDAADHAYYLGDQRVPSITQLLEWGDWIDPAWYTPEACARGTAVHQMCADYDLGALDPDRCRSPYKAWLDGYVQFRAEMGSRLEMTAVEEALPHVHLKIAGRPDRQVVFDRIKGVFEIKSGGVEPGHPVQTALQAILVAPTVNLKPEHLQRWCLYLSGRGRARLVPHTDRSDFNEAYRLAKRYWKRVA